MMREFIFGFIAIYSFCILFKAPKSELIYCGLVGAVGWLLYCVLIQNLSNLVAMFVSVAVVGIMARILSIKRKMPLTIFIVAGIMPFVPGGGIYNSIYKVIMNDMALATTNAVETVEVACVISIGIVVVLAIPEAVFKKLHV